LLTLKQNEFSKRWPSRTSFFACPWFTVSEIASASFLAFFARQSTAVSAKRYTNARLYIYARLYICIDNSNPFAQYRILWTGSLKMHTLHVIDACRACWHAATRLPPNPAGALFNVADQGDTDQGKFNKILSSVFRIETDFYGTITSNLAKLNFAGVCEMANEKHTEPWTQM